MAGPIPKYTPEENSQWFAQQRRKFKNYQSGEQRHGELIDVYLYADPHGNLSHKVERREGLDKDGKHWKKFPVAHLIKVEPPPWDLDTLDAMPKERWDWHWPPIERRYLYHLPELIAAPIGQPVFVAEGEKDVERLRSLGLIATTCLGGAGKWYQQYNEYFAGRTVIILVDLDTAEQEFAGQRHALKVKRALRQVASAVRAIVLPGQEPGQDVSDWLDTRPEMTGHNFCTVAALAPELSPKGWSPKRDKPMTNNDEPQFQAVPPSAPQATHPEITIVPGSLKAAATELELALMNCPIKLYQQGGKIVEPVKLKGKSFDGTPTIIPGLREVPLAALTEYADSAATFIKQGKRGIREIQPPEGLLKIVLARPGAGRSQLPVLRGMIHTPLVLLDGRVIEVPGYDEPTGVLYEPLGVAFPSLPTSPTKADAQVAVEVMWQPFQLYTFRDETPGTSRAVILAAILTVLERPLLDAVPLFAVDAPRAGVGKGYLCSSVSQIAIGELPIVTAPGQNYEEEEKILKAIALDHPAIIMIDNVTRPIQGSHIESFITAPTIGIRKFGVLEHIKVPNTFVTFYNGNQLQIAADAVRRTVKISLSTDEEHPEHKRFEFLPHELAAKERPQIVAAALTVIKAFLAVPEEQRPELASQMGSFEGWSNLVRRALVWVGEVDPNKSQESIAAEDPARSRRGRLLMSWEAAQFDGMMTSGEFLARATALGDDQKPLHPQLMEALKDIAWSEQDQQFNSKRLTRWLLKARDIIIDGRVLRSEWDSHSKQLKWKLQLIGREMPF